MAATTPIAITSRMARATTTIIRSPARANPTAAAITRLSGVAMTASSPSHRKPAGSRARMSATSVAASNGGPPASGEMPLESHQADPDQQQRDRQVGDRDE